MSKTQKTNKTKGLQEDLKVAKPDIPDELPDWIKEEILRSTKASCLIPYIPTPPKKDSSILDRNTLPANTNKYTDKLIRIVVKDGKRITTRLTPTGSYVSTYEQAEDGAVDGVLFDIRDEAKKKAEDQSIEKNLANLGLLTRKEELIFSGIMHKRNMTVLMSMFAKAGYAARCYPIQQTSEGVRDYFCLVVYRTPTALRAFENEKVGPVGLFHIFKSFKELVEVKDEDARQIVES